ncbi:MAG: PAS domain S-box protein, partial [Spirochaetia bacterium]|nr:PAS domain S-box protein [Spirochaetia bacterium]
MCLEIQNTSEDILESVPEGILIHDSQNILFINKYARGILKVSSLEDLSDPSLENILDLKYHRIMEKYFTKLSKNKETISRLQEVRFKCADGEIIELDIKISSIFFKGESSFITVLRDMRKNNFIKSEVNKFLPAVDKYPVSIVLTDKNGKIEYINSTFAEETGYSLEEVIGQTPRILKSGLNPPYLYKKLWKTILSGEKWHGELQNKKKNGEFYWEKSVISPIFDGRGNITNFVALKENITERKKIERLKDDTEQLLRHDLKNLLSGIIGLSRLLMISESSSKKEVHEMSSCINKNSREILDIINNSFDLYKMETGTYIVYPEEVNLPALIAEIVLGLSEFTQIRSVSIDLSGDNGLLKDGDSLLVFGAYLHLKSLFVNIIKNAVEASSENDVVKIKIFKDRNGYCNIEIHNTGVIPESIRENFFDRYSTVGKTGGTGIGTYSAYLITKVHGGNIAFASSESEGT